MWRGKLERLCSCTEKSGENKNTRNWESEREKEKSLPVCVFYAQLCQSNHLEVIYLEIEIRGWRYGFISWLFEIFYLAGENG